MSCRNFTAKRFRRGPFAGRPAGAGIVRMPFPPRGGDLVLPGFAATKTECRPDDNRLLAGRKHRLPGPRNYNRIVLYFIIYTGRTLPKRLTGLGGGRVELNKYRPECSRAFMNGDGHYIMGLYIRVRIYVRSVVFNRAFTQYRKMCDHHNRFRCVLFIKEEERDRYPPGSSILFPSMEFLFFFFSPFCALLQQ